MHRHWAMNLSPRCGARTRSGSPCRSPAVSGKRRCRMHGGAAGSGAPEGKRNGRYRHGLYGREWLELKKALRELPRATDALAPITANAEIQLCLGAEGYGEQFASPRHRRALAKESLGLLDCHDVVDQLPHDLGTPQDARALDDPGEKQRAGDRYECYRHTAEDGEPAQQIEWLGASSRCPFPIAHRTVQ